MLKIRSPMATSLLRLGAAGLSRADECWQRLTSPLSCTHSDKATAQREQTEVLASCNACQASPATDLNSRDAWR